nr:uncharacterized protein LOC108014287 [Drosophila suzukii]
MNMTFLRKLHATRQLGEQRPWGPHTYETWLNQSGRTGEFLAPTPSSNQDNGAGSSADQKRPGDSSVIHHDTLRRGEGHRPRLLCKLMPVPRGRMSDEMLIPRQGPPESATDLILMKSHKCLPHMQNGSGKCHD